MSKFSGTHNSSKTPRTILNSGTQVLRNSWGLEPSHNFSVQLVRSLIVSVIAVIVNFGGSYIFKEKLGIYYLLAATLSFSLGVIVNYILSIKWVFAARQLSSKHAEFIIFAIINLVGLAFNLIIIAGMVEILNTSYWLALTAATITIFFWNFMMRKRILY